jgi:hypothetical protein
VCVKYTHGQGIGSKRSPSQACLHAVGMRTGEPGNEWLTGQQGWRLLRSCMTGVVFLSFVHNHITFGKSEHMHVVCCCWS